MADILTNLRELSVALYFYTDKKVDLINPRHFLDTCRKFIKNCNLSIGNVCSINESTFSMEEKEIIRNGLNLGNVIKQKFNIPDKPEICWLGERTQSGSPIDLSINGLGFSLKEQSFILENMGLYKLLNIVIGENRFDRGLHIFETFSQRELNKWFELTRDLLIKLGPNPFNYTKGNYRVLGAIQNNNLILEYTEGSFSKEHKVIPNFPKCSYSDFETGTTSILREKVFSKWVKQKVERNPEYKKAKKGCSTAAGANLLEFVDKTHKTGRNDMLLRFLRIEPSPYFYAKSDGSKIEIYRVPGAKEAADELVIDNFYYEVRISQLNIITSIKNVNTGKSLAFRNELRYSHGQFNGTPEAKCYYLKESDLGVAYELIYKETH